MSSGNREAPKYPGQGGSEERRQGLQAKVWRQGTGQANPEAVSGNPF